MARVFYQPCSDATAQKNLQTTILNPVQLTDIKDLLEHELKNEIHREFPDGKLFIWGLASPVTKQAWEEMEKGDIVIFNTDTIITVSACFACRLNSRELALRLWGWKDKNQTETWENIYFVKDVRHHAIDFKTIQKALDYDRNRPFFRYRTDYGVQIFELYPELEREGTTGSVALSDAKKEISLQVTEGTTSVSTRLEHKYIVHHLFQGKLVGRCCICNKDYPRHLLVAAHIKKRSACKIEDKLDIENIALPMCRLGCDPLFEYGYLSVKNGKVVKHPSKEGTAAINEYMESVVGNSVIGWSKKNKKYFAWHLETHGFDRGLLANAKQPVT